MLKMCLTPICMAAFFVAYFHLLDHPHGAPTIMPVTALDRSIPFQPAAVGAYATLWLYVTLGVSTLLGRREITVYCLAVAALGAIGLLTFLLWPTAVPSTGVDRAQYPFFGFLQNVDASGNAFPSLHVAFAVFTYMWINRVLREAGAPIVLRLTNAGWCAVIAYSTLATKQHVAVDAIAGAMLGVGIGWLAVLRLAGD
jgi:membrane-associated phospholipid phosphatase